MGRTAAVLFAIARLALAGSFPTDGEALFRDCEFKAAAHGLGFGSARSKARKAQAYLETATQLDAGNREFLVKLFELYVDSPEYLKEGLSRAMASSRDSVQTTADPGHHAGSWRSTKQYSSLGWALRKGLLRVSGVVGYLVPQR